MAADRIDIEIDKIKAGYTWRLLDDLAMVGILTNGMEMRGMHL